MLSYKEVEETLDSRVEPIVKEIKNISKLLIELNKNTSYIKYKLNTNALLV